MSYDWITIISVTLYCTISTLVGFWAIDKFTGAGQALKRSRKWESTGKLSHINEDKTDKREV